MTIIYTEVRDSNINSFISTNTEVILENMVDSIFAVENLIEPTDMECIIEAKLDALVLNYNSLFHMYNVINITSRDSYKLGLQFVFKIITLLEEHRSEGNLKEIKAKLCQKIQIEMRRSGVKDFTLK